MKSNAENKLNAFLENARLLYEKFSVIPLLYGSLGLEYLSGRDLGADDIDVLIPEVYILEKWDEFKGVLESRGYILIDEREHTFELGGISFSYARIEELETFADIRVSDIQIANYKNTKFLLLSLEQYLAVYTASSKDGYRVHKRRKKDPEKVEFIKKLIEKGERE